MTRAAPTIEERFDTPAPRSEAVARALMHQHGLQVTLRWGDLVSDMMFAAIAVVPFTVLIGMLVIMGFGFAPGGVWLVGGGGLVFALVISTCSFFGNAWRRHSEMMRLFRDGTLVPARVTEIHRHASDDPAPCTGMLILLATVDAPSRRYRWVWHSESGAPCPVWGVDDGELRVFQHAGSSTAFLLPIDSARASDALRVHEDLSMSGSGRVCEHPVPPPTLPPARIHQRTR